MTATRRTTHRESRAGLGVLSARRVTAIQQRLTRAWHQTRPNPPRAIGVYDLVARQHLANCALWHLEDLARDREAGARVIAETKHRIDDVNQERNDFIERIDETLLSSLAGVNARRAEQSSETPGQIVDRLSVLALKTYHMREEAARKGAPDGHAVRSRQRLALLRTQQADLSACLDALVAGCAAGRRFFKVYRQLKMYNDPALNPALYSRPRRASAAAVPARARIRKQRRHR